MFDNNILKLLYTSSRVHIVDHEDPILLVPGPSNLIPNARRALLRHVGHRSSIFRKMFREVIDYLKEVFDTDGEVHLFTSSGTGIVETAIMNFISREDRVLCVVYGTFGRRFMEQVQRITENVLAYKVDYGDVPEIDKIRGFLEYNKIRELDVVTVVYNETNPGTTFRKLKDLAKLAHEYGAILIVDNVSGLGGDYFSCSKWSLDVEFSSTQKCLGTPPGLSFITFRTLEAERKLRNTKCLSTYFDIKLSRKFLEKSETPFTPAVNILSALREALSYICNNIGLDRWIRWHYERARIFLEIFKILKFEPYIKDDHKRSITVLSFKPPEGIKVAELKEELYNKYGIDIADGMDELKGKIVRIGNMGWITRRTITLLTGAIAGIISRKTKIENLEKAFEIINNSNLPL